MTTPNVCPWCLGFKPAHLSVCGLCEPESLDALMPPPAWRVERVGEVNTFIPGQCDHEVGVCHCQTARIVDAAEELIRSVEAERAEDTRTTPED